VAQAGAAETRAAIRATRARSEVMKRMMGEEGGRGRVYVPRVEEEEPRKG
jgi:hypothetical protein